jgi:hypothetical protein
MPKNIYEVTPGANFIKKIQHNSIVCNEGYACGAGVLIMKKSFMKLTPGVYSGQNCHTRIHCNIINLRLKQG